MIYMVTKEQINALISNQVACLDLNIRTGEAYATHLETFAEDLMLLVAEELEANERAIKAMSKVICKAL